MVFLVLAVMLLPVWQASWEDPEDLRIQTENCLCMIKAPRPWGLHAYAENGNDKQFFQTFLDPDGESERHQNVSIASFAHSQQFLKISRQSACKCLSYFAETQRNGSTPLSQYFYTLIRSFFIIIIIMKYLLPTNASCCCFILDVVLWFDQTSCFSPSA